MYSGFACGHNIIKLYNRIFMSVNSTLKKGKPSLFSYFKEALTGENQDYTQGSVKKAVFLLAIPMILEMAMESVFAVVDIYFVGKLGKNEAIATVVLYR